MPSVQLSDLYEKYAFLDPAGGSTEQKRSNQARSAIAVIAVDYLGHVFVLHAWADRVTPTQIIEKVIEVNAMFTPHPFGIEATAQQSLFADVLVQEALRQGHTIDYSYVHQPTHLVKKERIRSAIQPLSRAGRLFVQPHMQDLIKELRTFPTGTTQDLVDALGSAITLVPPRRLNPPECSSRPTQAIIDYLRRSGATQATVNKYLQQRSEHLTAASNYHRISYN